MEKKKKLFFSLLILISGTCFNLIFITNLHCLLKGEINYVRWFSINEIFSSMTNEKQHFQLFIAFNSIVLLGAIFYYALNHKPYQSSLDEITDVIKTPVRAGQGQYGSARWLDNKEKENHFKSEVLDLNHKTIKDLKEKAADEVKKVEKGDKIQYEKTEDLYASENYNFYKENEAVYSKQNGIKEPQKDQALKSGGIVLGMKKEGNKERIYYVDDDTHTLCIGATRSGKSRCIVLETIGVLGLAGESMIISDPKSELYNYTSAYLKSLGYEVVTLDFKNPLKSDRYNFLQPIIDAIDEDDLPRAIESTWDLTEALVPEDSHSEKIWSNGEASIIAAAIMAVVYDNRHNKDGGNRKFQNMSNVYFFISEMCKTVNGKMPLESYLKSIESTHPARGLLSISEVAPSKTRGSFFTSALTNLRLFTNPRIWSMTSESDFNPKDISSKKTALFIILPDEKRTYYSLASLFVTQCYMALVKVADDRGGRLENRVNMLLDEFGNFTQIPDFTNKLTVGGGRGIRLSLFIQSMAQLDETYNKEVAQIIKGNCETWIYLQADDVDTLEEISKKLGNYTVSSYSLSSSHGKFTMPSSSHSTNLTNRALLTIDEIKLISRPYALVTSRNHPAMMICPDLSEWHFNKLFALGDKEHNRKIREFREISRPSRVNICNIKLWNIWEFHIMQMSPKKAKIPSQTKIKERMAQKLQGEYTYEEIKN